MESYMPHGHCILWNPVLLWTMVISNTAIFSAYMALSYNLAKMVRATKHEISAANYTVILLFSSFIFFCGLTHLMNVITMWLPIWWMDAGLQALTAAVSMAAAIVFPTFLRTRLREYRSVSDEFDRTMIREGVEEIHGTVEKLSLSRQELRDMFNRFSNK